MAPCRETSLRKTQYYVQAGTHALEAMAAEGGYHPMGFGCGGKWEQFNLANPWIPQSFSSIRCILSVENAHAFNEHFRSGFMLKGLGLGLGTYGLDYKQSLLICEQWACLVLVIYTSDLVTYANKNEKLPSKHRVCKLVNTGRRKPD